MEPQDRQCAIECVGGDTLRQYQQRFEACKRDFDLLFLSDTGDADVYRNVVEPGHIYET